MLEPRLESVCEETSTPGTEKLCVLKPEGDPRSLSPQTRIFRAGCWLDSVVRAAR